MIDRRFLPLRFAVTLIVLIALMIIAVWTTTVVSGPIMWLILIVLLVGQIIAVDAYDRESRKRWRDFVEEAVKR